MPKRKYNKKVINSYYICNDRSNLIFKYLKPNENEKLSLMKGYDLQDLIILIDNYYIDLRDYLGLENDTTFGLEIEFENVVSDRIYDDLKNSFHSNNWEISDDNSLNNGAEINSPVLKDIKSDWQNVVKACLIATRNAYLGLNSGGHIHVGTQILGDKMASWLNFVKLWSVYENIIFRFLYGEFLTNRPNILDYAAPLAECFWNDYKKFKDQNDLESFLFAIDHDRYQAVNFGNIDIDSLTSFKQYNTIEFRCPNGTLNPIIWQNNVNFLVKLLMYSKSNNYCDDIVENRHQINEDNYYKLKWYNEIYLEQSLELCDMIFSNNLDKINFLKQYLKSFMIKKNSDNYPKAKMLTKRRY